MCLEMDMDSEEGIMRNVVMTVVGLLYAESLFAQSFNKSSNHN